MAFLRIFLCFAFVGVALAVEWDCSATSGTFTRSTDCVVSSEIVVTGTLNITGIPDANGMLPKIIGGGSNRLFKVDSGGELHVKLVNLTRGVASGSNPAHRGGAVYINGNGASFYAVDSALHDNTAGTGAGFAAYSGASVIMNNTHLSHNNGGAAGGAYCLSLIHI